MTPTTAPPPAKGDQVLRDLFFSSYAKRLAYAELRRGRARTKAAFDRWDREVAACRRFLDGLDQKTKETAS